VILNDKNLSVWKEDAIKKSMTSDVGDQTGYYLQDLTGKAVTWIEPEDRVPPAKFIRANAEMEEDEREMANKVAQDMRRTAIDLQVKSDHKKSEALPGLRASLWKNISPTSKDKIHQAIGWSSEYDVMTGSIQELMQRIMKTHSMGSRWFSSLARVPVEHKMEAASTWT
jgi:hypothetical protein